MMFNGFCILTLFSLPLVLIVGSTIESLTGTGHNYYPNVRLLFDFCLVTFMFDVSELPCPKQHYIDDHGTRI
ncbi:TPA: hypothetical protein ACPTN2_005189, partial [Escherichia coli]